MSWIVSLFAAATVAAVPTPTATSLRALPTAVAVPFARYLLDDPTWLEAVTVDSALVTARAYDARYRRHMVYSPDTLARLLGAALCVEKARTLHALSDEQRVALLASSASIYRLLAIFNLWNAASLPPWLAEERAGRATPEWRTGQRAYFDSLPGLTTYATPLYLAAADEAVDKVADPAALIRDRAELHRLRGEHADAAAWYRRLLAHDSSVETRVRLLEAESHGMSRDDMERRVADELATAPSGSDELNRVLGAWDREQRLRALERATAAGSWSADIAYIAALLERVALDRLRVDVALTAALRRHPRSGDLAMARAFIASLDAPSEIAVALVEHIASGALLRRPASRRWRVAILVSGALALHVSQQQPDAVLRAAQVAAADLSALGDDGSLAWAVADGVTRIVQQLGTSPEVRATARRGGFGELQKTAGREAGRRLAAILDALPVEHRERLIWWRVRGVAGALSDRTELARLPHRMDEMTTTVATDERSAAAELAAMTLCHYALRAQRPDWIPLAIGHLEPLDEANWLMGPIRNARRADLPEGERDAWDRDTTVVLDRAAAALCETPSPDSPCGLVLGHQHWLARARGDRSARGAALAVLRSTLGDRHPITIAAWALDLSESGDAEGARRAFEVLVNDGAAVTAQLAHAHRWLASLARQRGDVAAAAEHDLLALEAKSEAPQHERYEIVIEGRFDGAVTANGFGELLTTAELHMIPYALVPPPAPPPMVPEP